MKTYNVVDVDVDVEEAYSIKTFCVMFQLEMKFLKKNNLKFEKMFFENENKIK